MRQHTGPIGLLGVRQECPICKNRNLVWDHSSDVSSCLNCGWDNREEATENRNKQVRNGEVPK